MKWEMKLLVSRPNAVSRLSPSWSLPTVTTDKTCTTHILTSLHSSLHHLVECEIQKLKCSHGVVIIALQGHATRIFKLFGLEKSMVTMQHTLPSVPGDMGDVRAMFVWLGIICAHLGAACADKGRAMHHWQYAHLHKLRLYKHPHVQLAWLSRGSR